MGLVAGMSLWSVGCSKEEDHAHAAHGGGHSHEPKNGGQLVEVGKHQFNFEILTDAAAGKMTAWVLDAHAEGYVRIPAPSLQVQAKVDGQDKVLAALAAGEGGSQTDAESRMRLRSIDVQLLRILEEMSAGRQETLADLRADISALTAAIRQLGRTTAGR